MGRLWCLSSECLFNQHVVVHFVSFPFVWLPSNCIHSLECCRYFAFRPRFRRIFVAIFILTVQLLSIYLFGHWDFSRKHVFTTFWLRSGRFEIRSWNALLQLTVFWLQQKKELLQEYCFFVRNFVKNIVREVFRNFESIIFKNSKFRTPSEAWLTDGSNKISVF